MDKSKFRVLMLCEYFLPFDRGGTEWSVYYLAKSLTHKGHEVAVFTPNYGAAASEKMDKIKIFRFPFLLKLGQGNQIVTPYWQSNLIWLISTCYFLFREVRRYRPTHLHVQGKYLLPAGVIIGKLFKIPVISTVRDYIILCPYAHCISKAHHYQACTFTKLFTYELKISSKKSVFSSVFAYITGMRGFMVSGILRFFLKKCTAIVAISKQVEWIYVKNGIAITHQIYNSYSFRKINHSRGNYLLYAGRLTKGKGVDILVKAYSHLLKKRHLPILKIVGDGPLKFLINNEKIENINHLPYSKVQSLISHARLVIVPSVWEEPFGRVALEALAHGVPVVASRRGALPEIITDGLTGILIEPTEKEIMHGISQALKKEEFLRKNSIQNYHQQQKKFQIDPTDKYIKLYTSL